MERYAAAPSPEVLRLLDRDEAVIAGVEKLRFMPLAITAGEGSYLVEAGGRRLLDLSASWTAAGLGYGHPAIVEAVTQAVSRPAGASGLSAVNDDAVGLAEALIDTVPAAPDAKVYLGNSGTDANDVALRACRSVTGNMRIIAFRQGYHGGLGIARDASHVLCGDVSPDPFVTFLPYPDPVRPSHGTPEDTLKQTTRELTRLLDGGDVACVILEPIQSDGGIVIPVDGFLSAVRQATLDHHVPMIVDEVKVGLARTGFLHAFEYEDIAPDIVTFGKSLGAGLPISAAVGPSWAFDRDTASALLTSAANPVSAAAGRAVLRTIASAGLADRAAAVGGRIARSLQVGVKERGLGPVVGDVRGRGLTMGIDLVRDGDINQPDPLAARKIVYRAWQLGAVVYYVGGNVLEVTPPLTISDEEADEGVSILLDAIAQADRVTDDEVRPYSGW